ncbi:hypothetical protein OG389_29715 [Streptomyces sp. NBC_00435]|uniref:hypothetical protein n=1 Tax=Streptomyces sp. NBC_00435 TaxID=2903649 RepID=UPI002E201002
MKTMTKICSGLGTALLLVASMALTSGSAAAAQPLNESLPTASKMRLTGHWTESIDRNRPGITFYIQELTFTSDGHFEQINDVICNQENCPAFKIGMNKGTYRTDGRTIRLDGSLYDLNGTVLTRNTISLDKHVLHRVGKG